MSAKRAVGIGVLSLVGVLCLSADVWAWGPATHIKLAADISSNLWMLPPAVAAVIAAHRRHFFYGNVATDTVFAKKFTRVKQICHHWTTGFGLLNAAETDETRAFAYGYLCHLAADTVAHNKFLPRQMAVSRSTVTFGHLYWEIRADAKVGRGEWEQLRSILHGRYPDAEGILRERLIDTLLSFRTNQFIFRRMNLLASERAWRRSVDFWSHLSRFKLDDELVSGYHGESIDRIADVLTHGGASRVLHEDPNGNSALAYARAQRRQLRQLRRANIRDGLVIAEAATGHAPARRALLPDGIHGGQVPRPGAAKEPEAVLRGHS